MKRFLSLLLFPLLALAQTNVQKGSGNVLSNGSVVVGSGTSITATGTGTIAATSIPTLSVNTTAPLTGGGALTSNLTLAIPAASGSVNGYLSSTDWATFNGKQPAGSYVLQSTTVNGHALSSNVTVTASDVGLGSVTNAAQTLASVVPNTLPTAGQILVGNAGGTAYAPVTVSGDGTLASTGALTVSNQVKQVSTIAALRALSITGLANGTQVSVAGYYAAGDGGGGPVRVLSTGQPPGTYTDNGGSIIVPTGGNGTAAWLWQWSGPINVKWFGAYFDNTHADQTYIQSALNYASSLSPISVVDLPAGTSKLTATIAVPSSVTMRGQGGKGNPQTASALGATVLHGTHTGVVVSLIGSAGCKLKNLGIYGDPVTIPKVGLQLGRDVTLGSAGDHDFTDLLVSGYYQNVAVSSVASENNNWYSTLIILNGGGALWGMLVAQGDPFSTGAYGGSNVQCNYFGLDIINYVNDANAVGLFLSTGINTRAHNFYGCYSAMKAGRDIWLSVGVADSNNCPGPVGFYGFSGERIGPSTVIYGIQMNSGVGSYSISGLTIEGCRFDVDTGGYFLRLDSGATLTTSRINVPTPAIGGTLSSAGSFVNSEVNFGSTKQFIGTVDIGTATATSLSAATLTGTYINANSEIVALSPSTANPSTIKAVNSITIASNAIYSVNTAFQCGLIIVSDVGSGNCGVVVFSGGNAATVLASASGEFTPTANNNATVNFYYASGGLTIQNKTASSVNLNLLTLRTL